MGTHYRFAFLVCRNFNCLVEDYIALKTQEPIRSTDIWKSVTLALIHKTYFDNRRFRNSWQNSQTIVYENVRSDCSLLVALKLKCKTAGVGEGGGVHSYLSPLNFTFVLGVHHVVA